MKRPLMRARPAIEAASWRIIEAIPRRRKSGLPTRFSEATYLLDLALDRREAAIPVRPIPWDRYTELLKDLHLRQPLRKLEWQAITM